MTTGWIKKLKTTVLEEITPPPIRINLEKVSSSLGKKLDREITINCLNSEWRESPSQEGVISSFLLEPLSTPFFFVMDKESVKNISSSLFGQELNEPLTSDFYTYLMLEVLDSLKATPPLSSFGLKMVNVPFEKSASFCIDLQIETNKSFFGTLIIPQKLKKELEEKIPPSIKLNKEVELPLTIESGNVQLSIGDLQSVKEGSFIVLDRSFFNPGTKEGNPIIRIGEKALFYAQLVDNKIKIVDFAQYEETVMEKSKLPSFGDEEEVFEESLQEAPVVKEEKKLSLQDIDLTLKVEMAQFNISFEKLSSLSIGSFLELNISNPEMVSLTLNGQKIGSGELLYVGDRLGVRVTEILK